MNEMTNSHILIHQFDYHEPKTLEEAVALLATHGDAARVLAGGTDLIVQMKMERLKPAVVIGIGRLAELKGIRREADKLILGALTSIREIARDATVRERFTALAEACTAFSTTQVQVMGTIGGNLCNGSPASDSTPALIALGAEVVLTGPDGETRLPLERFFRGPGKTTRRPDQLLTAVEIPNPAPHTGSAFVKVGRVAADIAKANAAVTLVRDGDRVADCRLAFGSVAPTPLRAARAEQALIDQVWSAELVWRAAEIASEEVSPIDDVRSTAAYRRQVVCILAFDALTAAWERTKHVIARSGFGDEAIPSDAGDCFGPNDGPRNDAATPTFHLAAADRRMIRLQVNGRRRAVWVAPNDLLLNVLRDDLELTGTKYGCGIGECSACTVLMDDKPVLACLVLAASADGHAIRTVEGLAAADGALDPLQEAFLDHAALQCGFCTPGMLMTAKNLLEENPHPTEADVRDQLRGNMCRCTGYAAIVRAVLAAAEA